MKKIVALTIISCSLFTKYCCAMDYNNNSVLTIKTGLGEVRSFTAEELSERHKDLCAIKAERLVVVNSKTLTPTTEDSFVIELSDTDKAQVIKALLSSNAQDAASLQACYVVDVANLQPLPQAIHDIIYGKPVAVLAPTNPTITEPNPSIFKKVFNPTTLTVGALCLAAGWVAGRETAE